MLFEERQHTAVGHMHRGHCSFARLEAAKGVAAGIRAWSANGRFRRPAGPDEEGVDRDQFARMMHFNLAFAKLGAEASRGSTCCSLRTCVDCVVRATGAAADHA